MSTKHSPPYLVHGERGSALVITLAMLVLICVLVLSFFVQSTLSRKISSSSAGQYNADLIARTALDTIIGDLRTEIAAGSKVSTSNGVSIYIPTTNLTAVPYRVHDQGFPNLVKQSVSSATFWSGAGYDSGFFNPVRSAPGNSTATPSGNGRSVSINQWNKPGLLGDPGTGTLPSVPGGYTAPDWVIVTRKGAVTNATALPAVGPGSGSLSDKSAANQNYAIGRFAYVIYDEGGLLDINVAGFPGSARGSEFESRRGLLPQVDLANIPGIDSASHADAFIQWRNQASAATTASYTNRVFSDTNGFVTVAPGDQSFLGRMDLINYATAHPAQVATSALQYLGTFSRERNAPSYSPPALGSAARPPFSTGAAAAVGKDDLFNPSLIDARVSTPFTRQSDGSSAKAGDPLIKYRFPLSRLKWLSHAGPDGATAQEIYDSFGLTWSDSIVDNWSGATASGWVYNHGSINGRGNGQTILYLSDVASLGREPDFFELLQAGMQLGSLGKGAADGTSVVSPFDTNVYYQVIQIGANMIDQYDTDSLPAHISFNNTDFYGIEDLPYLAWVYNTPYRLHGSSQPSGSYPAFPNIGVWLQPVVWNPHAPSASAVAAPAEFRVIATGNVYNWFYNGETNGMEFAYTTPVYDFSNSSGIVFSSSAAQTFRIPTLLSPGMGASAAGNDRVTDDGLTDFIGISTISSGTWSVPDYRISNDPDPANSHHNFVWAAAIPGPYFHVQLQYREGPGRPWVTYDVMRNINDSAATADNFSPYCFRTYAPLAGAGNPTAAGPGGAFVRSDPRTDRFGVLASGGVASFLPSPNPPGMYFDTIRPGTGVGSEAHSSSRSIASPGWSFGTGNSARLGTLTENTAGSDTHYADPDTVVRAGDGAYANGSLNDGGYPIANDSFNSLNSRPIMLNRPFRSVADIGYVFRGMPWKGLDLFTSRSGDSALLDLFCVQEPAVSASAAHPPAEAGKLNLNSRQKPVIAAALAGAIKSETDETVIDSTTANTIAGILTDLTTSSSGGPFLNKGELATRLGPALGAAYASQPDSIIKRRREAAVRALADIGNTRTWNLLIDVIAQSGRYGPKATSLNQFIVTATRRYWLHVSIDRYTGKVIYQYLEPVL